MNPEHGEGKPTEEQTHPVAETETSGQHAAAHRRIPWRAYLDAILITLIRFLSRGRQAARQGLQGDGYSPMNDVRAAFGHLNPRRLVLALLGLAVVAYLLSGLYTVQPGEVAVVRRFGKVVAPKVTEGLHYRLPWPIDTETLVNVSTVRRESIGLTRPEPEHPLHLEGPGKLQVLSGDTNIVDYEVIVQYQIRDPAAHLFNLHYPHTSWCGMPCGPPLPS